MPSPEEYRRRAKEARNQAKACGRDWERQGLLIIADQCERLAAYKDLTGHGTAPGKADLETGPCGLHSSPATVAQTPIILGAKP